MRCSIKKRYSGRDGLPSAPRPTRPIIVKEVQGISHHLEVREAKPPVVPGAKKKSRGMWGEAAWDASRQKRAEERRQRIDEAVRLYQSGMTVQQIADHMEIRVSTAYDYTRGVRTGLRKGNHAVDEDVIRMYGEGKTYKEIGDALDMSTANVSAKLTQLRRLGLVDRRNQWNEH